MIPHDEYGRFCGFLMLKTTDSSWLQKLFILDEQLCFLRYFNQDLKLPEELEKVKDLWNEHEGEINIRLITKIEERSKTESVENCFEIETCETKYLLQADNKEDMDDWIRALRKTAVDPSRRKETGSSGLNSDSLNMESNGNYQRSYSAPSGNQIQKPKEHISYETKVVGGVVFRTPVRKSDPNENTGVPQEATPRHRSESDSYNPGGLKTVKEGYCIKKGAVVKNWKKRYFRLDIMKLTYYEREKDKDPLRTVPTTDISKVRESMSCEGHRENLFEVVTPNRTFLIQAESSTEMLAWINAFNEVLMSLRGRTPSGRVSPLAARRSPKRRSIKESYAYSTTV